jgi:hypothetical protein
MRICLHFDPSRLLRWHLWLAHALAEVPNSEISRSFAPLSYPLPAGSRLLFELERLIYGFRGLGAMDRMEFALLSLPVQQAGQIDVVIDLSGEETSPKAARVLRPFFNGVPSEIGIMAALANDQDLLVELHDTARPSNPWTARPARQDREVFSASLDASLSCATALILKALHYKDGPWDFDGFPSAKSTKRSSGPMSASGSQPAASPRSRGDFSTR